MLLEVSEVQPKTNRTFVMFASRATAWMEDLKVGEMSSFVTTKRDGSTNEAIHLRPVPVEVR
jgi:hypothetical protein